MKKKLLASLFLVVALGFVLTACGGSKFDPVGSWYFEQDEDVVINLEEGGAVLAYDSYLEEVSKGDWVMDKDTVEITIDGESLVFTVDNDALVNEEEGITLTRGEHQALPQFSVYDIADYWIDQDNADELEFYSDYTWDLYTTDFDFVADGEFTIEGDTVITTDTDGNVIVFTYVDENTFAADTGSTFVREE